jgi:hypothetical protein
MIFRSYNMKKTKSSLYFIILISPILDFPRRYAYFRRSLDQCKFEVSLYLFILSRSIALLGAHGSVVVEALCYKTEGRGIAS